MAGFLPTGPGRAQPEGARLPVGPRSKAKGVDAIPPDYLKSLNVEGQSWLTNLYSIVWRSGTGPLDWQNEVVPLFNKGDIPTTGDHTPQPSWESLCQSGG